MQIIELHEKLLAAGVMLILGLYENIISHYAYLMWEPKVKTLRKHMKIISECIIYSLTLNPEDLNKFKQFKYADCV